MSAAAKLSASTVPAAFAVQIIETRMVVKGRFKTMAAATFASWKHGECKGGLVAQPVGLDAAGTAIRVVK